MPSRREFLQTGAAVSAIAANGVISGTAGAVGAAPIVALRRAIYDDRYAEGRRFAEVVAARGVPTRALDDGDITRFWYDELETLWRARTVRRRRPHAVRADVRRRAARARARHAPRAARRAPQREPTARWSTRFTGPRETLGLAAGFETLHSDWPGLIAALACSVGADDSPRHARRPRHGGACAERASECAPGAPSVFTTTRRSPCSRATGPRSTGRSTHGSSCRAPRTR